MASSLSLSPSLILLVTESHYGINSQVGKHIFWNPTPNSNLLPRDSDTPFLLLDSPNPMSRTTAFTERQGWGLHTKPCLWQGKAIRNSHSFIISHIVFLMKNINKVHRGSRALSNWKRTIQSKLWLRCSKMEQSPRSDTDVLWFPVALAQEGNTLRFIA